MRGRKIRSLVALALSGIFLAGCAKLEFYDNPAMDGSEAGVKFYTSKPYLLVARTGAKDKPIDISVVYLPDMAKPLYVKARPGLGSADLSANFSNSVITSFNQKTDSKIPELLTALGGFGTSIATARKTIRETDLLKEQAAIPSDAGPKLRDIAADLVAKHKDATDKDILTSLERQALKVGADETKRIAAIVDGPTAEAQITTVVADLNSVVSTLNNVAAPTEAMGRQEKELRTSVGLLKAQIADIRDSMKPKPAELPSFTLYEFDNSGGTTVLKEVKF